MTTVPTLETLTSLVECLAERGEEIAIVEADTGREVRAGELAAAVAAQAKRWRSELPGGATVGLSGRNSAGWLAALLGAVMGGLTVATINPVSPIDDLVGQLHRARAARLLAGRDVAEDARGVLGDVRLEVIPDVAGAARSTDRRPWKAPDLDDVVSLMTSSGVTGRPKTVQQTHRAWVVSANRMVSRWHLNADDVYLAVLPFSHAAGLGAAVAALASGARVVILPRFDPSTFLSCLEHHGVTALLAVPPILRVLANHPALARRDLPALRLIGSAGAPLPAELHLAVESRIGVAVCNGYGMTETGWVTLDAIDTPRTPGTLGRPLPEVAYRLVDPDTGCDVPAGVPAELWVRGPACSPGYVDDPGATELLITGDGWTRTGDLLVVDDGGCLRLVDRLKDLIKYKAHQVSPTALEELIATRADVADVAVVGAPDPDAGQIPHAVVVPRSDIDPQELMTWIGARVAPQHRVRAVSIVDRIPRSPAGKTLRRLLEEVPGSLAAGLPAAHHSA